MANVFRERNRRLLNSLWSGRYRNNVVIFAIEGEVNDRSPLLLPSVLVLYMRPGKRVVATLHCASDNSDCIEVLRGSTYVAAILSNVRERVHQRGDTHAEGLSRSRKVVWWRGGIGKVAIHGWGWLRVAPQRARVVAFIKWHVIVTVLRTSM